MALFLMFAVKTASDAELVRQLTGRWPGLSVFAGVALKDVLIAGVWALAMVRRRVAWRRDLLRIGPGSVLSPAGSGSVPLPVTESA